MNMREFDIYFRDLNTSTQKELLKVLGISNPEDVNWGTFPICTLEIRDEKESAED